MANRRFGESKKEYKIRLKREEMEASTHIKQRLFESDIQYIKRAEKEDIRNRAGIRRGLGSEKEYLSKARSRIRENETGVARRRGESEADHAKRSRDKALDDLARPCKLFPASEKTCRKNSARNEFVAKEKVAGTRQGVFESNHAYEKRVNRQALENIAESSGINLFESDEHYNRRIKLDALNKNPSLVKLLGLDEDN